MTSESDSWLNLFQESYETHIRRRMRVEGKIPAGLKGCYFQNGPCHMDLFDNIILSDGLLREVCIENGAAFSSVSELEPSELSDIESREAHIETFDRYGVYKSLWKKISFTLKGRAPVKNVASTSIWQWQEQLMALYEVSLPKSINLKTLKTETEYNFSGTIKSSFSAHPHYLPARQSSYNFGTRMGIRNTWLDIYVCPDEGEMQCLTSINLKRQCFGFIHDFAVTENYLVFFLPAIDMGVKEQITIALGGSPLDTPKWRAELGSEVLIIPIDAPQEVIRFSCESFFSLHVSNAYEKDEKIIFDYIYHPDISIYRVLSKIHQVSGSKQLQQEFPEHVLTDTDHGRMQRAVIDINDQSIQTQFLSNEAVEFPRINSAYQGKEYRYSYTLSNQDRCRKMQPWFEGYRKFDFENNVSEFYKFPIGHYGMEPCFIASGSNKEDEGYVVASILDSNNSNTYIAIFDAQSLQEGPIAKLHFDQPLPIAFHGIFTK